MTAMTTAYPVQSPALAAWRLDPQRIATATTAAMLAPMLPTAIALAADPRLLNGATLWLKPLHFQMSLALHFATLALLLPLASAAWRQSRLVRWMMLAAALSAMLEVIYITLQAARGRASHFNQETGLEIGLYALMGIGALMLVAASAIIGIAIWRSMPAKVASQFRLGAAVGLVLGSALTLVVAGYMSNSGSHLVGGQQTDANGLPFLGWATRGGDLRVPHFFATHAMQTLPVAGLLADRFGLTARWLITVGAALYCVAVLALFSQALMGIPLIGL